VHDVVGVALVPGEIPAEWRDVDYLTTRTVGPKVIEAMGKELKIMINTCTKPGTKNEVFLPESWSVLNR
jgi:hypothetical protein